MVVLTKNITLNKNNTRHKNTSLKNISLNKIHSSLSNNKYARIKWRAKEISHFGKKSIC